MLQCLLQAHNHSIRRFDEIWGNQMHRLLLEVEEAGTLGRTRLEDNDHPHRRFEAAGVCSSEKNGGQRGIY